MSDAYRDRVAVVTGASRGIGAGIARVFARRGLKVGMCARSAAPAEDVPRERGRSLWQAADVRDAGALDRFAATVEAELGPIDLWVNNAGLLEPVGPARDLDPAAFRALLEVNVLGVLLGARTFFRRLREAGRTGTLVNIGSGAATTAYAGWSAYCASKAAVAHLTRVLAKEERPAGNRVYCLAPGMIETGMQEFIRGRDPREFPEVEKFRRAQAEGRLLDPESPAEVILRLAFDPAPPDDPVVEAQALRERWGLRNGG